MAKVLVLYHSIYGHIEAMANAVAEGARGVAGAKVDIKRVPETMPEDVFKSAGGKSNQAAPIAQPGELANYDAIIFGTGTRFGNMTGQMRNFLDQTGPLWMSGALVGKVGSVFSSSATQHGGQESTILSFHTTLLHQGMIIVGLPYAEAAPDGSGRDQGRQPLRCEHDHRRQGRALAQPAGTRHGAVPGQARDADRDQAVRLTTRAASRGVRTRDHCAHPRVGRAGFAAVMQTPATTALASDNAALATMIQRKPATKATPSARSAAAAARRRDRPAASAAASLLRGLAATTRSRRHAGGGQRVAQAGIERASHQRAEDGDREQARDSRHRVVDARRDPRVMRVHRVHDGGRERRDGHGHAEAQTTIDRKERGPVAAADARTREQARNPRRRSPDPTISGRLDPKRSTSPPDHRDSTNRSRMNGRNAAPAAAGE